MAKPASRSRVKERPAPTVIDKQVDASNSFDTTQYIKHLESLVPQLNIPQDEFEGYQSHFLIRDFVSHFSFDGDRAALAVKISKETDSSMLELLAERFRKYLKAGSLDEAFGLTTAAKPGKRSPRTKAGLRAQTIQARALYLELMLKKMPSEQAVEAVASTLKCGQDKAKNLLFRKSKGHRR